MVQAETQPPAETKTPLKSGSDKVTTLKEVAVEGHYDNSIGTSDSASQGIVRGELLQDIPLLRPGEALETIPGMVVTQHSGDGKANQYFLRGYNLDHGTDFTTRVDGVPINMPTNAHGQGYSDLNFLIPELVDRIEYRKGPYYAENGDFSAAGSADIRYRNSLDRNIASLTLGSYDYKRALLAGSTTPGGKGQDDTFGSTGPTLLGALELQRSNGPWTVPEDLHKTNALLRLSDGDTANGWALDAVHYDASWISTDQVPLTLIESGQLPGGRFGSLDPTDGGETGRDIVSGEWRRGDGATYTKASAYAEHYRLQLWSDFTFYVNQGIAPNPNLPSDQFSQVENRNIVGGQVAQGWMHTLFGKDSVSEAGLQIRHDNINVGLLKTQSRIAFNTVSDNKVSETGAGAYLQNTTTWNPWLRTLVGLREDAVQMDMISASLPANSGSGSASQLSPKLSMIFGPWEKTEFFINAGRGFHSNDARGVIDKIEPATGNVSQPVPALVAAFGKEVGVRTEMIDGLQSSVSIWSLNSNSELVYTGDAGTTEPNGASRRYGLEWNNHYVANRWLLLDADLAWTHARYATMNDNGGAGDMIPNAVSKVARAGATIHQLGPWTAALETRYFGSYPLTQDGSLMSQPAAVSNLRVRRDITPDISLTLDALNIFDHKYYDVAYGQDYQLSPTSPYVPSGVTVHPGEPREFRVTLGVKF